MKVKCIITTVFFLGFSIICQAQILKRLEKKIERKVNQRIDRKTDRVIDKGLDEVEEAAKGNEKTSNPPSAKKQPASLDAQPDILSKFDFIPGERILFFDNFEPDAIGDFPVRWNTNGSGEIVTIQGQDGKWLKIPDNTVSFPELSGPLPQGFTVEFDLFYSGTTSRSPVTFGFSEVGNPAKTTLQHKNIFYYVIPPSVNQHIGYSTSLYSGRETTQEWPVDKMGGKAIRVSIAVNEKRVRLYMDHQKIFDLPKAFDINILRNNFHFRAAPLLPKPQDGFYVANIRIAESGKDVRSMLLKDGSYSTTGIYFNSGSSNISARSHGVIKEVADILRENGDMKMMIIGHTDSDGNEGSNMKLSLQRAEAVRAYLNESFGVAIDRLSVDGKGASSPVSSNATLEGKAQNRRVVFVKK